MDPITASAALQGSSLTEALGSTGAAAAQPNLLIHQGGGSSFAFKLPEAPQVAEPTAFPATQVYTTGNEPSTYNNMAMQMVNQVNHVQTVAGEKLRDVLMGGPTSVNDAMVAAEESSVSFTMLSTVRDKLVDSYQQIMSMQV
jgi:flagellar hook-basal body complex protein FliE